ncbi:MAG: hypothetical protein GWN87_26095, partial [Desulfuromonadales bacterium]|nr:hypothetical protein [Desulfuromonadales bacterium]NIS43241.1 hypothetical protein [Desulfuromonadales bacterium]
GAVDTAIEMRDHTMMTDADIAEHFNIPIADQESIDRKRAQIAGRLEIMSLQDQAKVIQAGLRRDIDVERLTDLQ